MNNNVFKEFLKEYEELRESAANELEKKKLELYKKIPRVREIDNELSNLSISITKAILNDASSSSKLIAELQSKSHTLHSEKYELLTSNNYPVDYLSINYKCKQCQDTGFINNSKCACLKQRIINNLYKQSNLNNILSSQNFDTFNFDYYSDSKDKEIGLSPKRNMQIIYKTCLDFASKFDGKNSNLLFTGPPGLGKTFLSSCIAKDLLDKGITVFYQTAYKVFDMLEDYHFNKSRLVDKYSIDMLFDADVLIIDDLGTEFVNSYTSSEFFNILNSRLLSGKKTIISTNLDLNELSTLYSERIISRILENYKILKFFGEDIRIKKNLL